MTIDKAQGAHWDECYRSHHDCALAKIERLTSYCSELAREVERRGRDIRAALEDRDSYRDAIDAGGWDISPCDVCGTPVVCLPDGLPCCRDCATKTGA